MKARYRVCIIHGSEGRPAENWFPWLKDQLEQRGHTAIVPQFPTPAGQSLSGWTAVFEKEYGELDSDSVLIGHSTGAALALNLLHHSRIRIAGTFLAAGFVGQIQHPHYDELNSTFFSTPFDFRRIRQHSRQFFLYSGDDDPFVPMAMTKELSSQLACKAVVIPGGGHLNAAAGFGSFPELVADFDRSLAATP